jgi:Flp pilus assembly protein TadG
MNNPTRVAGLRGRVRRSHPQKGQEIVEFAFTVPLLLMAMFAIMWGSRTYNTYQTMTRAAREGARYAVAPTCALCGSTYPTSDQVSTVVVNYLQAASLRPSSITSFTPAYGSCNGVAPACTTSSNVTVCRGVPVSNSGTQQCGTAVSFAYPVPLSVSVVAATGGGMSLPSLTLKTQVQMVPEQ